MKTKIKATNIVISPDTENYLAKKLESVSKIIDQDDPTLLIEVELGRTTGRHQSGDLFRAEINFNLGGKQWRAVAEAGDLYSAIDEMRDDISDALRAYKGKKESLIKRGGARIKALLRKFYK